MESDLAPAVPLRILGRRLRELREKAGLSRDEAAERLGLAKITVYRIERGRTSPRVLVVDSMCRAYGAPADISELLTSLAKEKRQKRGWHSYGAVPEWFEPFVDLEQVAGRIRQYEPELIPGLLQTPTYAGGVYRVNGKTEAEIERAVQVRMGRQTLITRKIPPPPHAEFVINEAALRRPISDRAAMAEQLVKIAEIGTADHVQVRVLPLSVGPHQAALAGSFTILEFPGGNGRGGDPTTVYSEDLTGGAYLEKPTEVAIYDQAWRSICAASLDDRQSRELITTIAKEYDRE